MQQPGAPSGRGQRRAPPPRSVQVAWALLFMGLALYAAGVLERSRGLQEVPYSEFETALSQGRIARVVVTGSRVLGYPADAASGTARVLVANRVDPQLAERLAAQKVVYSAEPERGWFSQLLTWLAPSLVLLVLWALVLRGGLRQGIGSLTSIGKSRANIVLEKSTGVTFADVAGVDEAKDELREVVDFLKDPQRYGRLGAHMPKGVLLVGPPGTGKTLLARALAGEAGVSFLSTNGAEFVEMFVGVGAARVRDLFDRARAGAPAIIFIDELDALGRARGAPGVSTSDEKEQTLNQLLAEMDGFDPSVGVIILAATNRPEILDPALLRAGRFDRQVLVDRPDLKGRVEVLRVHARKVRLAPEVDLAKVAGLTAGFAGADLANVVNEAALLATRRGAEAVGMDDLTGAIERIVAGLEKRTRVLSPNERRIVACHEMGHALVAMMLPGTDPVQKVSVIPRGIAGLGYTIQRPTEDRFLMTREELHSRLAVMLGGRAAEMLVFGMPSTGAADDLVKATALARASIVRYGMHPKLGPVAYEHDPHPLLYPLPLMTDESRAISEATAREVDCAVRDTLLEAYEVAVHRLRRSITVLETGSRLLLERETLTEEDLAQLRAQLAQDAPAPPPRSDNAAPHAMVSHR